MNLNATLIGQSITFFLFVLFCMKFVWPPITQALEERKKKIADGLAAAEKGQHDLELAKKRAVDVIKEGKDKAGEIIHQAERQASEIVDGAKERAKVEADRILVNARSEIEQEANQVREQLRKRMGDLVVIAASKILEKEVDAKAHASLIENVAREL
jgi:F-type H+-transporting ATPase subunit b